MRTCLWAYSSTINQTYRVWCGRVWSWGLVPRFLFRRKHQSWPIASQPARREPPPPRARRRPHSRPARPAPAQTRIASATLCCTRYNQRSLFHDCHLFCNNNHAQPFEVILERLSLVYRLLLTVLLGTDLLFWYLLFVCVLKFNPLWDDLKRKFFV